MASGYYLDKEHQIRKCDDDRLTADAAFQRIKRLATEAMRQVANAVDDDVNLLWAHENLREVAKIAKDQIENGDLS